MTDTVMASKVRNSLWLTHCISHNETISKAKQLLQRKLIITSTTIFWWICACMSAVFVEDNKLDMAYNQRTTSIQKDKTKCVKSAFHGQQQTISIV